jgi:hypothetical protein
MGPRPGDLAPRGRPRPANAPPLVVVSAAGPCGAWRSRELTTQGQGCGIVAPALSPQPAGARVHTARREAVPRARLRRAGARTPGAVPQGAAGTRRRIARGTQATQVGVALARALVGGRGAIAPPVTVTPSRPWTQVMAPRTAQGCTGAVCTVQGQRPPPRFGVTRAGVTRPLGTRAPRWRPAPDGCTSGGITPRIAAGAPVGGDWLRRFPGTPGNTPHADRHNVTANA